MSKRPSYPAGTNCTGETTIASVAGREFWWAWYWSQELERVARENPGYHVVGTYKGQAFGGVMPAEWGGKRIEVEACPK